MLTDIVYSKDGAELTRRSYTYDALARPTERQSAQQGRVPMTDTFGYSQRSELISAQVSGELYGYDYDNIGNRRLAFGGADYAVYTANELNQYTKIDTNGSEFTPKYDAEDDTGANDPNGASNDPRVFLDCLALTYSDHFKPRKMEFARFPIHGSKSCDC